MFVFFVLLEAIAICDQITIISVGGKILISRCIDVMQEEVGTVANFPIWPIFCSGRDFVCTCTPSTAANLWVLWWHQLRDLATFSIPFQFIVWYSGYKAFWLFTLNRWHVYTSFKTSLSGWITRVRYTQYHVEHPLRDIQHFFKGENLIWFFNHGHHSG